MTPGAALRLQLIPTASFVQVRENRGGVKDVSDPLETHRQVYNSDYKDYIQFRYVFRFHPIISGPSDRNWVSNRPEFLNCYSGLSLADEAVVGTRGKNQNHP